MLLEVCSAWRGLRSPGGPLLGFASSPGPPHWQTWAEVAVSCGSSALSVDPCWV